MSASSANRERRRGLGLRREISLLFPLVMLVVIVVAIFSLFAYRNALSLLSAERRDQAERMARTIAQSWTGQTTPGRLRSLYPETLAIAVLGASGQEIDAVGEYPAGPLPVGLSGSRSTATGLDSSSPDRVSAYARLPGEPVRYLRLDLAAPVLAAQRRGLRVLFAVVLPSCAAALLLVVLFARRAFAPYDALLERARSAGAVSAEQGDEITSLVRTFERALAALARPATATEDDIAALERALAPSLESGLLLLDRELHVLALNAVGAEILDLEPPIAGTPLSEAFAAFPEIVELLQAASAGTIGVSRREIEFRRRGERRTLGFSLHSLRRDDGSVRGYLTLFADLTAARRLEEERRVERSLSELGGLTAGLAHELRNSLATLRGYLGLIERRPEEERLVDYMAEIRRETDQLQRVLEDFLSFAQPGSTRLEATSLEDILQRAVRDPRLEGTAVRLVRDGEPLSMIQADPQLLERVLRNLLHNAIQAQRETASDESVEARLRNVDDGVLLEISDRGAGVPEGIRPQLFQPFASARPGGVGLGLALSHRIVSLHGGSLRLEDREGGGTRVELWLPSKRPL